MLFQLASWICTKKVLSDFLWRFNNKTWTGSYIAFTCFNLAFEFDESCLLIGMWTPSIKVGGAQWICFSRLQLHTLNQQVELTPSSLYPLLSLLLSNQLTHLHLQWQCKESQAWTTSLTREQVLMAPVLHIQGAQHHGVETFNDSFSTPHGAELKPLEVGMHSSSTNGAGFHEVEL